MLRAVVLALLSAQAAPRAATPRAAASSTTRHRRDQLSFAARSSEASCTTVANLSIRETNCSEAGSPTAAYAVVRGPRYAAEGHCVVLRRSGALNTFARVALKNGRANHASDSHRQPRREVHQPARIGGVWQRVGTGRPGLESRSHDEPLQSVLHGRRQSSTGIGGGASSSSESVGTTLGVPNDEMPRFCTRNTCVASTRELDYPENN